MAVNSFNAQNPPVTTKGDLFTFSTIPTRLGVGTNNTVLTADSSTATGLKWGTVSSDITWSLVNTGGTSLSGAATVTVSGITKDNIMIYIRNVSSASTGSLISFRFNSDSTNKYCYAGLQLRSGTTYTSSGGSATINSVESAIDSQNKIEWHTLGSNAADYADGFLMLRGAKGPIKVYHTSSGAQATGTDNRPQVSGGLYTGSSAITSVSIISSVGNFDLGTIFVYEG